MSNLAGEADADRFIREELTRARIPIVEGKRDKGEVPATLTGRMNRFLFRRAWRYWVVEGEVPLSVANVLYLDPVGKTDVRSGGDCACRPPVTWARHYDPDGRVRASLEEEASFRTLIASGHLPRESTEQIVFVPEPAKGAGRSVVDVYHIDSEVGLRLFADTLRHYELA